MAGAPSLPDFTPSQRQTIRSYLPKYEAYLKENNPTIVPYHAGSISWASKASDEIMKTPEFQAINLNGKSPAKVHLSIRTFFRNYRNNTFKRLRSSTASPDTPAPTSSPSASPTIPSGSSPLIIMDSDLSAKQLFFYESPESYTAAYKALKSELPKGTPACVISSKARKRAWKEADREFWESRKTELESDVASNQDRWPQYVRAAIQQSLERGIVGTGVVAVAYAFRTDGDGMKKGFLYAGFDSTAQCELLHHPKEHGLLLSTWASHADRVMPHLNLDSAFKFEVDESGNIVLPCVDLGNTVLRDLKELLRMYFERVWAKTYPPDNSIPALPWADLPTNLATYCDTAVYTDLPSSLASPVPCHDNDVIALYTYLHRLQTQNSPFSFRAKEDVDARLMGVVKSLEAIVEEDDEDLDADLGIVDAVPVPAVGVNNPSSPSTPTSHIPDSPNAPKPDEHVPPQSRRAHISTTPGPSPTRATPPSRIFNTSPKGPSFPSPDKNKIGPAVQPTTSAMSQNISTKENAPPGQQPPKKAAKKRRTTLLGLGADDLLHAQGSVAVDKDAGADGGRRSSTRKKTQAEMGLKLVANGERSPKRQPSWALADHPEISGTFSNGGKRRRLK